MEIFFALQKLLPIHKKNMILNWDLGCYFKKEFDSSTINIDFAKNIIEYRILGFGKNEQADELGLEGTNMALKWL